MAMALVQLAAVSNTSTDATVYSGAAGAPAIGDLVIVTFYVTGFSPGNSGFTATSSWFSGGGYTWKLESTLITGTAGVDRIFIVTTIATSITSITPTITLFGNATGCIIKGSRITGLEGQSQLYIRQSATATASTANPSVTLPVAALTGNGMWGVVVNLQSSAAVFTAPTGWTSHVESSITTPPSDMCIVYRVSGFSGTAVTWTCAQTVLWNAFVMELYVAGTGPTANTGITSGVFGDITSI
jgi:hypothetical protein